LVAWSVETPKAVFDSIHHSSSDFAAREKEVIVVNVDDGK
jgi:hypothetical protein